MSDGSLSSDMTLSLETRRQSQPSERRQNYPPDDIGSNRRHVMTHQYIVSDRMLDAAGRPAAQ